MNPVTVHPRALCLAELASHYQPLRPGQSYVIDHFRPEDAPGIARLYYGSYGDSFPIDYVYDPDAIITLNAGPDLYHVVGRTPAGDIVGVYALFRNPPGQSIMEAGSVIVDPAYRGGKLVMGMTEIVGEELPRKLGLHTVFGQTVCDHLVTQKIAQRFGSLPYALEIEALPNRPLDRRFGMDGRISLLDCFRIMRDQPHEVFLPDIYADWLRSFYAECGLQRGFLADQEPAATNTDTLIQTFPAAGLTKITVNQTGRDVPERLSRLREEYPETQVWQLVLPLSQPGSGFAVNAARARGFFLGGLLPHWSDRDMLLMQKLEFEFDAGQINLLTEQSRRLLALILSDHAEVRVNTW